MNERTEQDNAEDDQAVSGKVDSSVIWRPIDDLKGCFHEETKVIFTDWVRESVGHAKYFMFWHNLNGPAIGWREVS